MVFAMVIMMLLLSRTVLYKPGSVHHTPVWPWDWGKKESSQPLR